MNNQLISETQNNNMGHQSMINGIMGVFVTAFTVIFVTVPHKIAAWILSNDMVARYVNADAKQMVMDLAPFIGAATGIAAFILYVYKIRLYHKKLKSFDSKSITEKQKEE